MAEQIEEQISEGVVSGGDGGKGKSGAQIAAENRVTLYNDILNLKEPGFSDVYKKAGFKKFDALLKDNQEFQSELLNDLIDRGFKIDPANFSAAYTNIKPVNVYELPKEEIADTASAPLEKDNEGKSIYDKFSTFSALKNMAKNVYNYGKESLQTLSTFGKRGTLTGLAGMGAQAENFATGTVDTRNLAKYLKQAHEVGTTQLEADFAKDDGMWQDSWDMAKILVPSVVESFANMFAAGSKKLSGAVGLGALGGATYGSFIAPGFGTTAGAIAGGSRALQYAMLQQGYNLEFVGTVIDELQTKKLINMDADEKTLENQLKTAFSNKELMAPIFKKANIRASAITGVDFIFSGMGSTVARNLAKSKIAGSALNTPAGKLLSTLAETTVANPVYRKAARLANRVAQIDKKIQGSKIGRAGATVGVADVMGGAAGETLAQSLTQDNLDFKSITVEGLSEGKFINTLRQLGSIGERKNIEAAVANVAQGNPPGNEEDEFVAVTQQELDDYKKGNITPERAAGIKDDLDIALGNANHINKLAVADPLYAEMVKDAYNKAIKAFENQKLYGVAITEMTTLHNLDENGVKEAINPSSSSFNPKIANDFKNTLNVLQQQYKKETGDDSEDTTRVSGEVGGGQESQQTKSQQGASEEKAGDDRVVQEAADEVRLSDIDEMLADDDDFFNQSGDRLLSPEERKDLEQERAKLTTAAATTTQQTAVENAPIQEGTQQTGVVSPQPAPTEVVGGVGQETTQAGAVAQQPAAEPTGGVGETVPGQEGGAVNPVYTETDKKGRVSNYFEKKQNKPDGTIVTTFEFERSDKGDERITATTGVPYKVALGDKWIVDDAYVPEETEVSKVVELREGDGKAVATVLFKKQDGTTVLGEVALSKKAKPKSTTKVQAAAKAEPKKETKPQIAKKDVSVRKGKDFATEGVYEVMANGEVIGRMYYDKSLYNAWVDADVEPSTPSTFKGVLGTKPDAMEVFINRYNATGAAKPAATKKAETKAKAEEVKKEVKTEEKPKAKTETKSESISANDVKSLTKVNEELFGLDKEKASAAATVMDSMIGQMAKRAGVTKEEMYAKLEFRKATAKGLPTGVKLQLDAWHGSPYQFAKFLLENIDTGEGAQAFGWGLYFTELQGIAEYYAKTLSALNAKVFVGGKEVNLIPDNVLYVVGDKLIENNGDIDKTIEFAKERIEEWDKSNRLVTKLSVALNWIDKYKKAINFLENNRNKITVENNRNLYKVTIFKGKKRYTIAPIQSLDQKWNVYDSRTWDRVQQMSGAEKQGILDDLDRAKPEKRFNSKEEALSWIDDNNEYTFLEWDKQVDNKKINKLNDAIKESLNFTARPQVLNGKLEYLISGGRDVIGKVSDVNSEKEAIEKFKKENQKLLKEGSGKDIYYRLAMLLGDAKAASLFLLENGIDGIKYPAESIAAGRTSDTARGFNYVIFDENAISIEDVIKFQKDANKARGAVMVGMDGQAVVYALTNPNVSTPLHELAHVYEHYLSDAEKDTVLKSAGTKEWNTETSEYFARGFEKYLAEGKSPNEALSKVFEKFKQWLGDIYKAIKGSPIDVKLNKDMRKIYAQMLGAEETKAEAKQEVKAEVKGEVKAETPAPFTKPVPTFAEFDAISADRGKMKEAKAAFIEKHGQLAYDAMKEISTNFTKITKALQEKEILTKKC